MVNYIERNLSRILADQLQSHEAVEQAVRKCFQEVDDQLRRKGEEGGSTVSLGLVDVEKGSLVIADLGDSYAFISVPSAKKSSGFDVVKLSHKQSPGQKSERRRIERAGGVVDEDIGGPRVGELRFQGWLFLNSLW